MTYAQPPRIPNWLLERFGIQESVVGDLVERYAVKRSSTWYWRQVLMAIGSATWQELTARKLVSVAAVSAGWGVLLAVFGMSSLLRPPNLADPRLGLDRLGFWTVWLNVGPSAGVIWTHWWVSLFDPRVGGVALIGFAMSG
jgi:hypothetical protein